MKSSSTTALPSAPDAPAQVSEEQELLPRSLPESFARALTARGAEQQRTTSTLAALVGSPALWTAAAVAIIAVMNVLRFVALDTAPLGFFRDEAAGALNSLCVAQTGADSTGTAWRMFFPQFGYWAPGTYIYFNALWSMVFGSSVEAFRGASAVFGALTVGGVYALSRMFVSRNAALIALLSASVSPALFHFSRVAWETPTMPAYLLWGLYFFLRSDRVRDLCLAALLLGLCCYTYSAGRVVVPLALPMAAWLRQARHPARRQSVACFLVVFTLVCIPLGYGSLFGNLMARANDVSIFSKDFLQGYEGPRALLLITFYVQNLLEHFGPKFLFVSGDLNPRHSISLVGNLSWLDAFALTLGFALLLQHFVRGSPPARSAPLEAERRWLRFVLVGVVIGVTPAAITHEGLPHAIRSSAAWPMYALLVGAIFARLESSGRPILKPAVICAGAFVAYFLPAYFYRYPTSAHNWYDEGQIALFNASVRANDVGRIRAMLRTYDALPLRYQLMVQHGMSCQQSKVFMEHVLARR